MTDILRPLFSPREGAVLDLLGLRTLADSATEAHAAALLARWPGAPGLVLEGLELDGDTVLAPVGPPGTLTPRSGIPATVRPGKAVLKDTVGRLHLVSVDAPISVPWPDDSGPRIRATLVLYPTVEPAFGPNGVQVARDTLVVKVGFVPADRPMPPNALPLATAVGNSRDWATDLARVLQPESPIVGELVHQLEQLERRVWEIDPVGAVWDRAVHGRAWDRYQTIACAAIEAALMQLGTHALTSLERARVLATLRRQLERSVEPAATQLVQAVAWVGPYSIVATEGYRG